MRRRRVRHNRLVPSGHSWLRAIGLAAAVFLLNGSVTFESTWPTPGVRWRGLLSIEFVACVLILLATRRAGRLPRRQLDWLTGVWMVLVLGHYAEVTAAALYGRDVNLFWDLRFVPDVAAMLVHPERLWVVVSTAVVALLGLILAYRLVRWALCRVAEGMADARELRVLGALATIALVVWTSQRMDLPSPDAVRFARPVTVTYARQARLMVTALGGSTALTPSPPMDSDLSLVHGADVFLIFVEAYGAVSYERQEFAERLTADRARFDAAIRDTGKNVVSAYVESPTFGGSSWLAHITLLSGVEVGSHDAYALLMAERRDTLVSNFRRHGYRTVAVMPGLWQDWPEGKFYGFDDIYGGPRLEYHGPPFGWWDITDQFAMARLDQLEVNRAPRSPLFAFLSTISTHVPFTPTPPYQPDWARILTDDPYEHADVDRAYLRQPDWMDLGATYPDALSYFYSSLSGYLRLRADRDFVMVVIGDHQPAAAVSGEGAPWDVPVHVIASRQVVLDRLLAHGFRAGVTPSRPALGHMHTLTPILLETFGERHADQEPAVSGPVESSRTGGSVGAR